MIILILGWFFTEVIASTLNVLWEATSETHRFDKYFFSFKKNEKI
jgi:hypothetical protein